MFYGRAPSEVRVSYDAMSLDEKLELLMTLAGDDREGFGTSASDRDEVLPPRLRHFNDVGALRPLNLRTVSVGSAGGGGAGRRTLLRILMTNACSFNCHYCPMRRDRRMPRTLLKPEELVRIFLEARRRGWCDGLFLTTGIPARPVRVMDDLIRVLELLRERHRFEGYIHTKILAGAEQAQIERITALASRVSVNLEAPCGEHLTRIAPEKRLDATLSALESARTLVVSERSMEAEGRPRDALHPGGTAGMTMQFVVGATPDSDRDIMTRVTSLYRSGGIHHTQFSAFRPIRDTPLESVKAAPALREQRLYQVDHLVRGYGFGSDEIVYDARGNLPLATDPKVSWALTHPERFPVEVVRASYRDLLRVPGIGRAAARRLVAERRATVIRGLGDLSKLGVVTSRAAGFLTLRGRRLSTTRWAEQLGFWQPEDDVGAHHLLYDVSPGTFR